MTKLTTKILKIADNKTSRFCHFNKLPSKTANRHIAIQQPLFSSSISRNNLLNLHIQLKNYEKATGISGADASGHARACKVHSVTSLAIHIISHNLKNFYPNVFFHQPETAPETFFAAFPTACTAFLPVSTACA